jgi:hypothetical protein
MKIVMIVIYAIELILIFISIINLIRVNRSIDTENKNLEELIKAKEANLELRFENYEYEEILNNINIAAFEKGQGSIVDRFDKIKEVIQSANKNNF